MCEEKLTLLKSVPANHPVRCAYANDGGSASASPQSHLHNVFLHKFNLIFIFTARDVQICVLVLDPFTLLFDIRLQISDELLFACGVFEFIQL